MNNTKEIKSVKINGCGYLLNGNIYTNGDNELIKQWLSEGNIPEPEFTNEELAQQELQIKIQEAQVYLSNTDWYYARKAETGEDVPVDVVEKRIASRQLIQDNKGVK